jgi:hypothetical protein
MIQFSITNKLVSARYHNMLQIFPRQLQLSIQWTLHKSVGI